MAMPQSDSEAEPQFDLGFDSQFLPMELGLAKAHSEMPSAVNGESRLEVEAKAPAAVVGQREQHRRKSKTNHSFLKKRYFDEEEAEIKEEKSLPEKASGGNNFATPDPKKAAQSQELQGRPPKRANSHDFEALTFSIGEEISTAPNSINSEPHRFISCPISDVVSSDPFLEPEPPTQAQVPPHLLQLSSLAPVLAQQTLAFGSIIKASNRSSFDFMEMSSQRLWEMTNQNYREFVCSDEPLEQGLLGSFAKDS